MHISITSSSSSCIDLVFTSLPNLIIDSSVYSFLHPNYHHQIVYANFDLEFTYPPLYLQEVWHYQDVLILNLLEEQLTDLIGQEPLQTGLSLRKSTLLTTLLLIF